MKGFDDNNKDANPVDAGGLEAFSRHAVGSLFTDDNKKEGKDKSYSYTTDIDEDFSVPTEPPYKTRIKKDQDLQYADYINSATEANRREQEINEIRKEESKKHIDRQWDEIAQISDGKKRQPTPGKSANPTRPHKPMPPVNIGNLAILGFFVMLIAFAVAMWQVVSFSGQLNYIQAQLEDLQEVEAHLRTRNAQLEADYQALAEQQGQSPPGYISLNPPVGNLQPPPTEEDETTTQMPPPITNWANTHRNAEGQLIYTVQAGEGLWGIANRFLGSGAYVSEIVRVNNLPNDQVAEGQEIIIPGL